MGKSVIFDGGSIPIRSPTPMPTIYVDFADGMREEKRNQRREAIA